MNQFLQQLLNGLFVGSIYALIALGYTMVYGVLRFINFAHGDVFMVGAYAGYYIAPLIAHLLPAGSVAGAGAILLLSMLACGALGVVIELLAYRPLRGRPKLTVLITAIGVSLLLSYGGQLVFGPGPHSFPDLLPRADYQFAGLTMTSREILVPVVTVILLLALTFVVMKTKVGMAMRALSLNPTACSLVGVNTGAIISLTFFIGSSLAGAAGILYAMNYPSITPLMGVNPGIKAFVAAVLGGIGNIPGAALGGLLLGVLETFIVGYSGQSAYRDAIAFTLLIAILLFKPSGLLGKAVAEKV